MEKSNLEPVANSGPLASPIKIGFGIDNELDNTTVKGMSTERKLLDQCCSNQQSQEAGDQCCSNQQSQEAGTRITYTSVVTEVVEEDNLRDYMNKGDAEDHFNDNQVDKDDDCGDEGLLVEVIPQSQTTSTECNSENSHRMYKCAVCLKLYGAKKSFEYHVKTQHSEDKYKCTICSKTFKAKNDLDRHVNVHNGVRPYPCPECDKSFICRSSLNRHRKLQHLIGDIYKCHVCEKSFRVEQDLNRHLHTHTGTRPWSCDLCSKSFTCKSSLNVHRRGHDESKKLCCQYCEKRFHIKMDLVRHETLHTGDRRWGCAVCSKKYSGKSALKRHIKDAHFFSKFKSDVSKVTSEKGSEVSSSELLEILQDSGIDADVIDSCIVFKEDPCETSE